MESQTCNQKTFNAKRAAVKWMMLIYFCSGTCSLIDEVVWVRLLKLTLGNTVYASSIVVSMFMGGLAIGALIMSRFADRVQRRLRLYAILEVCATVSALSIPWLLKIADLIYSRIYTIYGSSPKELLVVQVVVSAGILLIPAMVMGSTLPLLGRYITSLDESIGNLVGKLYALNTLGAAMGCFLAGFVLIRIFGVMGTLYIAAGINLLVATGGWVLSRKNDTVVEAISEKVTIDASSERITLPSSPGSLILLGAFFISGLISIGYELVWMRSVVFPLGGYTYIFSGVLTVYLLGNVIGASIGSRLAKRLKNPAMGFGISMTCLGLFGIIYFPWLSTWCFQLAPGINDRVFGNMLEVPAVQSLVPPLYYSIFLFLLPSIAMGIGFPLALQAWSKYHHKVGQTTGIVYGANTIGAVLGGIVTGFLLIPKNGAQLSITILGIIGVWLGALMLQAFAVKIRIRTRVAFMATAITLTIAAIMIPLGIFEQKIVSRPDINTLAVREGLTTTVAVNRKEDGTLALTSDGVNIAGDGGHRVAQKMLGHLGPFLNINAKEVLSVGFGSGETTACLSRHNFERIDCVEIAPEVVDVALDYFSHINLGDKLNEKVNMIYMDGKNYLYLTDKKYDIIINGADVPTYPGSAPMFGKEHFQNALNHLNPGGLFITKLHLSGIPVPCFDSILGTFVETFRHTTIWFPTTKAFSFFYIVGSEDEQSFSLKHIAKQLKDENIRGSVSFLNWQNDLDVMTCYIGDENDILRYLKGYNVNSDYLPFVEFSYTAKSKQDLFRGGLAEQFVKTVRGDSILNHIDWSGVSDETRQLWLSKQKTSYQAASHILDAAFTKDSFLILRSISKALQFAPDKQELVEWLDKGLNDLKEAIEKSPPNAVLPKLEAELRKSPDFGAVWLASSWVLQRKNVHGNALDAAKKAVLYMPYSKLARENLNAISKKSAKIESSSPFKLAILAIQQNKIEDAILHFDHALTLKPQRSEVLNNLAWLRAVYNGRNSFDPSKAVKHALKACELTQYKKANYIDTLAIAYAANGDFSKAVEMEKRAIEIANLSKQQNLIENFQKHLSLFKKSKPYHESIK